MIISYYTRRYMVIFSDGFWKKTEKAHEKNIQTLA